MGRAVTGLGDTWQKAKKYPFKQRLKGVVISWMDYKNKRDKTDRPNSFAGLGLYQPDDCKSSVWRRRIGVEPTTDRKACHRF
ncbi:hypothetical protein KL86DES1_21860 [uncultured Desulfovibrio sp.]|uniref:Uncharacterized protein n=1 Tax=uncultured Desulfovibrio sp. TaxID=167968 RepID=A0A212L9Z3_9BACT|nr:hypothetical protein KL86DES1_21860 [uncultured Desulfovibrio sp.]VZH34756.1 conserved protein of unknown function [Desulfovibrio sp. 86]